MAITLDALRSGLKITESVEQQRNVLSQGGQDMMQMLVGMKETEDYLFFAAALGEMRRYAGGEKLIPGSYLDGAFRPLADKMEELDSLIACERAGVSENVKNPFIFSELRQNLGSFAHFVGVCIEEKNQLFNLGQEEIKLLRALDGMNRHYGLSEHPDWAALRKAAPAMQDPVPMDERVIDDLKTHWLVKSARLAPEKQRQATLADTENGRALLLLNSRQAALADDALRKNDPKTPASPQSRPYLLFYSVAGALGKYLHKYEDQMDETSVAAMKDMTGALLLTDITLAGPDSNPDVEKPDVGQVQELLTEHFWPKVVQYFGSFSPNSRISEDDSRLFRMLQELQNTLALPEAIGGADMRKVYNFVPEQDKREALLPETLDMARRGWSKEKTAIADQKRKEEEAARIAAQKKAEEEEAARIAAQKKAEEEEAARIAAQKKLEEEEAARNAERKEQKEKEEKEAPKKLNEETAYAEMEAMMAERKAGGAPKRKPEEQMTDEELFQEYMNEAKERVEKKIEEQRRSEEEALREREKKMPPPDWNGKTWGEFTKALEDYMKQNVKSRDDLNPRSSNPRPQDIPHITQVTQFLLARKRFDSPELQNQLIDQEELVRETNQLLNDPGYSRLLKDGEFRGKLAWRAVNSSWERIMEASAQAYKERGQTSPYVYSVLENRANRERAAVERQQPMKTAIDSVYARLTDERYNADIRKTGFLFFKPSDTGLFQTAVRTLGVIAAAKTGSVRAGDMTTAKQAVKEYLDARKAVRAHEYGNRRWEKMMCAYKALEEPEKFERYCEELNAYRGIKDPLDPNYVHPAAFDSARMDLNAPQAPMNEALRQLKQDYAKEAQTNKDTATLQYFARVSAMRAQAAEKSAQAAEKDLNGVWGTLVDMDKIRKQAEELARDPDFMETYRAGDRRAMFAKAAQILHPRQWEPGSERAQLKPEEPEPEKQNSIGSGGGKVL